MPAIPTRKPPCPSYILRLMTRGKDDRTAPRAPHSSTPIATPARESTPPDCKKQTPTPSDMLLKYICNFYRKPLEVSFFFVKFAAITRFK